MEIRKKGLERFVPENSKYLFLGSFPSVDSLKAGFYFMNPRNRFYKVMQIVFDDYSDISTLEKKKEFLKNHNIALWDVFGEVLQEENSSSDKDIKNYKENKEIEKLAKEKGYKVFVLGKTTAWKAFKKAFPELESDVTILPSTSPQNRHYTAESIAEKIAEKIHID